MRVDPLPRLPLHAVLLTIATVWIVACTGAAATPTSSARPSPLPTRSAPSDGSSASPSAAAAAALPRDVAILAGRRGAADLHLILASTGETIMDVPLGAPRPGWGGLASATADGDATIVRDGPIQPGLPGLGLRIDGHWQLPTVGLDPLPVGRSLDGSTIVLVEGAYDPSAGLSRFAIVEHHLLEAVSTVGDAPLRLARIVELPGAFEYDTVSPDGRILYVVQHLDAKIGGHYQVRAIDVASGVMRESVIVDKGNPEERMAGSPIAQVRRPGGLVLTLYRGPEHPFIHALNSTDAWAICIDLPAGSGAAATTSLDWGLAPSADGASAFAVNASLGLAVDVDLNGLAVRRSASIATKASAPVVLAKFGHSELGSVGRHVVASPDGTTLFASGADGVTVIGTKDLAVLRHDLAGNAIDSLGVTPDGMVLFALLRPSGEIVALATADGTRLAPVPGRGYDRLLAVAPW